MRTCRRNHWYMGKQQMNKCILRNCAKITCLFAQNKFSDTRRRNEAYRGTSIDDNAVYEDLAKQNGKIIFAQFLYSDVPILLIISLFSLYVKCECEYPALTLKFIYTLSRQSGFYFLYLVNHSFLSLRHKIPIARFLPFSFSPGYYTTTFP